MMSELNIECAVSESEIRELRIECAARESEIRNESWSKNREQ